MLAAYSKEQFVYQGWRSGQSHESVKLATSVYVGSNPTPWTQKNSLALVKLFFLFQSVVKTNLWGVYPDFNRGILPPGLAYINLS